MAAGDALRVKGDKVRLRDAGSTDGAILATLAVGTRATAVSDVDDWTRIVLQSGPVAAGFMASRFLERAPPDYLSNVTIDQVRPMFPVTPKANITRNLPFVIAGLRRSGLVDRAMLLMALGTIRAETAGFVPIPEGVSKFNTSHGGKPFDLYDAGTSIGKVLGNTRPGDGARFKGRGYVQITGRSNYARIGRQLGVDLAGDPDLACDAATAGAILAQFLKNVEARVRAALKTDTDTGLRAARRLVNGGSHGLADFTDAYRKGQISLPA